MNHGHAEVAEDQKKHKEIINTQREFDHITSDELQAGGTSTPEVKQHSESGCQRDPHGAPGQSLAKFHLVGPPMEEPQVEDEHRQHEQVEQDPEDYQSEPQRTIFNCRFPIANLLRGDYLKSAIGNRQFENLRRSSPLAALPLFPNTECLQLLV